MPPGIPFVSYWATCWSMQPGRSRFSIVIVSVPLGLRGRVMSTRPTPSSVCEKPSDPLIVTRTRWFDGTSTHIFNGPLSMAVAPPPKEQSTVESPALPPASESPEDGGFGELPGSCGP